MHNFLSLAELQHGSLRLYASVFYGSYPCGTIEVYYNGRWGGICDKEDTWDDTASDIACKQLGYDGVLETLREGMYEGKCVMSSVYCTGREGNLLSCHHTTDVSGCRSRDGPWSEAVRVCCYYRSKKLVFATLQMGISGLIRKL